MKILKYLTIAAVLIAGASCSKENSQALRDDYIMKTIAPAITGEAVEFAYAMGTLEGNLVSAKAEVNIPGAPGTGFDPHSYHVDSRGNDIGVLVADTSTEGSVSEAIFSADTSAATLRFNYIVPEEAKGQMINLTFHAESSTGEKVTTTVPGFNVRKMDLKRDLIMTNNDACYFSIETMMSYTAAEVEALGIGDKIDLVYIYDALNPQGIIYGHSLVSPGTEDKYLNNRVIPASIVKRKTKIQKHSFIRDMQLSGSIPANFVDDIDFEELDLANALDFVLGISKSNSVFLETEDGKYRAYIYFNDARRSTLTFGIKRYEVF